MKHEILVYNKTLQKTPKKFIVKTILKALNFLKLKRPAELAVLIVNKSEIKRLNKFWHGKNEPADELSFGLNSRQTARFVKDNNSVLELGEIVINVDKIFDRKHLSEMLIHSLLHLIGYNHENSNKEAERMERLEEKLLKYLSTSSRRIK